MGPSTGLPTRTAQGDILSTAMLSHGDTYHPMLLPCSMAECFSMAIEAFDLAENLQTPVFVMSDLDLAVGTRVTGLKVVGVTGGRRGTGDGGGRAPT